MSHEQPPLPGCCGFKGKLKSNFSGKSGILHSSGHVPAWWETRNRENEDEGILPNLPSLESWNAPCLDRNTKTG